MFPPQTSFFSVRYAGAKANLLRARMRSIPTAALLLRVPSVAANARLSGQHASIRFLTIGTTVSIGLLGIVRVYIPHPLSSVHHSGSRCHAWTKNSGCECHYGMIITNHRHTPAFEAMVSLKFTDALYTRRRRMQFSIHFTLKHMSPRTSGQQQTHQWSHHEAIYPMSNYSVTRADHHSGF